MARNSSNKAGGNRKREASSRKRTTRPGKPQPNVQGNRESRERICFVMMPFTDPEGYAPDHFKRVYRYIIQPACELAGYKPVRVDDINTSNHIVIEIIRYIVEAEMAICDLSSGSPNVLYELGIRHAFNKPVTLIKDLRTGRMFDIQGLRDIEYDESLRADATERVIPIIADSLVNNHDQHRSEPSSTNSVINLLGIRPAELPEKVEISGEAGLILSTLDELRDRMARLELLAGVGMLAGGMHPGASGNSAHAGGQGMLQPNAAPIRFVRHHLHGLGIMRSHEEDGRVIVDFLNEGSKLLDPSELTPISFTPSQPGE